MFFKRSGKSSNGVPEVVEGTHLPREIRGSIEIVDKDLLVQIRYHDLREETLGVLTAALPFLEDSLPQVAEHLFEKIRSRPTLWAQVQQIPGVDSARERMADYLKLLLSGRITDTGLAMSRTLGELSFKYQINLSWITGLSGYLSKLTLDRLVESGVPAEDREHFALVLTNRLAAEHAFVAADHEQQLRNESESHLQAMHSERDRLLITLAQAIREAASVGDLTSRSDLKSFPGEFKDAARAVNDMLDSILVPLREAIDVLRKVKSRDLTVRIQGEYAGDHRLIPEALNPALDDLNRALSRVAESIIEVEQGAKKVADASSALSSGATEQASSLEEIRSTVDEVTDQVRNNSKGAIKANQLSAAARDHAEKGNREMQHMLEAMKDIEESAGQISQIIKVIEEIAFQTNLLSLNAAVEAARAGIHGKGFAVVADEVRNLAQRSARAAQETTQLIEGAIQRVKRGAEIATSTSETLGGIVDAVSEVTSLVHEIADSAQDQTHSIEQVNSAIEQIEQVTHHTAANAEEEASVAQQLSAEAAKLKQLISQFRITGMASSQALGPEKRTGTPPRMIQNSPRIAMTNQPRYQDVTLPDLSDLDDTDLDGF